MAGWVCQWKPFLIPVDDSFKKAFLEEWVYQGADSSELSLSGRQGVLIPEPLPEVSLLVSSSAWEPLEHEDTTCSRERVEAPLPPLQPRPTCERLEFPFSCDAILSGHEDLDLRDSDQFTIQGRMSAEEILTEHVVDIHRIEADVRDACERNQSSSSLSGGVNTYFLIKHLCRRDSASTTGTLGPDVEKKMLSKNELW